MSYNSDNSSVRFNSKTSSYNSSHDVNNRPSGSPKTNKDFKKVLSRDEKEDDNTDEVNSADEGEENSVSDEMTSQVKKKPLSLFDLTGNKKTNAGLSDSELFANANLKNQQDLAELPDENKQMTFAELAEAESMASSQQLSDSPKSVKKEGFKVPSEELAQNSAKVGNKTTLTTDGSTELSAKLSAEAKRKGDMSIDPDEGEATEYLAASVKDKDKMRMTTEQQNLNAINTLAQVSTAQTESIDLKASKAAEQTSNIQSIIDQLVDKVTELKQDGRTDTSITLKQPPMFAGATITLSEFDSAHGEFNIAFQNLSQAAKDLIDMRANQESLRHALVEKGYAVHIVSTSTLNENQPMMTDQSSNQQSQSDRERRDRENERDGKQQRRNS